MIPREGKGKKAEIWGQTMVGWLLGGKVRKKQERGKAIREGKEEIVGRGSGMTVASSCSSPACHAVNIGL